MATTLKTLAEFVAVNTSMRPRSYTVRFGIPAACLWIERIWEIDGAADHYLLEVGGGSLGWDPADPMPESEAWGEVILVVRAVSEHDADRHARKIMARAELKAERKAAAK